jgi:hypothetical protein
VEVIVGPKRQVLTSGERRTLVGQAVHLKVTQRPEASALPDRTTGSALRDLMLPNGSVLTCAHPTAAGHRPRQTLRRQTAPRHDAATLGRVRCSTLWGSDLDTRDRDAPTG